MNVRATALISVLAAVLLLAAACTTTDDDTEDTGTVEAPQTETTQDDEGTEDTTEDSTPESEPEEASDETPEPTESEVTPTSDDAEADQDGAQLRTFEVSEAGEIDIEHNGTELVLAEVRPNDGWDYREGYDDDDEIEVEFQRENREVEFEIEIDNGRVKVEISDQWRNAEDGVYEVGEAGEVEFEHNGDQLVLIEVRPGDGWEHTVDESRHDNEIEVDLRRDGDEAEFEAEIDDGRLEVDIKIEQYIDWSGAPPETNTDDSTDVTDNTTDEAAETYEVRDAGEVLLRIDGDRLVLVEVRPNDGWDFQIKEESRHEIEIEFRSNGREIDFEAELEHGRIKVDIDH
jgi:hypothetical protein